MFTKWCLWVSVRQFVAMIKALLLSAKVYVDFNKNAAFSWAWNHRSNPWIWNNNVWPWIWYENINRMNGSCLWWIYCWGRRIQLQHPSNVSNKYYMTIFVVFLECGGHSLPSYTLFIFQPQWWTHWSFKKSRFFLMPTDIIHIVSSCRQNLGSNPDWVFLMFNVGDHHLLQEVQCPLISSLWRSPSFPEGCWAEPDPQCEY